ncbi:hypothetical protein IMY05_010G0102100 [Salix suchowensis]|nr:hypothetical protein IMY05_010G0102100 [Salix suchowensis]
MASLKAEKSSALNSSGRPRRSRPSLMTAPPKPRLQSLPRRRLPRSLKNPRRRGKEANQRSTKLAVKCISCGMDEVIVPCYIWFRCFNLVV